MTWTPVSREGTVFFIIYNAPECRSSGISFIHLPSPAEQQWKRTFNSVWWIMSMVPELFVKTNSNAYDHSLACSGCFCQSIIKPYVYISK